MNNEAHHESNNNTMALAATPTTGMNREMPNKPKLCRPTQCAIANANN